MGNPYKEKTMTFKCSECFRKCSLVLVPTYYTPERCPFDASSPFAKWVKEDD